MRTDCGIRCSSNKKHPQTVSTSVKTSEGVFLLETTAKGLYALRFPCQCSWAGTGLKVKRSCLKRIMKAIQGYFTDPAVKFSFKIDLSDCTPFQRKVYTALRKVPRGETVTYAALAKRAGYPGAARAVGTAMKKNRLPVVIPCHRVVPASGGVGEYSAGKQWKRFLLRHEGLDVE